MDLDHDAALGWVDPTVEESIECVLQICQHIRQAKNEYNPPIVRKHNPILHIYAKAPKLAAELHVLRDTIQQLTHCNGVVLYSDERLFGNVQYVVKGAPTHDCLIGIVAESGGGANGAGAEASRKMLAKLDAEIEKLLKTIGNEGYKRSASESVQKRHREKVRL